MTAALFVLLASASAPVPATAFPTRVQAVATARIVAGERIKLDAEAPVPSAQRSRLVRREAGTARMQSLRLVEFQ
jgi:hypothetical protein